VVRVYKQYEFEDVEYWISSKLDEVEDFIDSDSRTGSRLVELIDEIRDLLDELSFQFDDLTDAFEECKQELLEVRNGKGNS
jgi:hypothetical protein